MIGLGQASRSRGDRAEALERFQQAAAIWPKYPWPLLEISAEYVLLGRADESEAALRHALSLSPRHYHVLMALGRSLRKRGERESALEMFRAAADADKAQTGGHVELAAELEALGRRDEALAMLESGLRAGAEKAGILVAMARISRASGKHEAALAAWKAALAEKPEDHALKLEIAAETASVGRPAESLEAYRAVLDDARIGVPKRCDAALAAHRVAQNLRDRARSIALLEQAAAIDAAHPQIPSELAGQYRQAGRFGEAEAVYRRVLGLSPKSLHALGGLAIVRRQLGDLDGALAWLETARAVDPRNDWIRLELGNTLRDAGRADDAGAIFESIEPTSSMHMWARMTLGHMARARGAHRWALEYFRQASLTATDPTDALSQIAALQQSLGDLDEAKSTIARIFARDPNSYAGHIADGRLKRAIHDRAGALAAFQRAAAARPTEPQPQVEIAAEARELGDDETAVSAIEAALKCDPRHEEALLKKAADLSVKGERDAALAIYARLREERPASVWAYLSAAQLQAEQGEFDAGLEILLAARRTCAPNSQVDLREATLLRQLGMQDKAFEILTLDQVRRVAAIHCHAAYKTTSRAWLNAAFKKRRRAYRGPQSQAPVTRF